MLPHAIEVVLAAPAALTRRPLWLLGAALVACALALIPARARADEPQPSDRGVPSLEAWPLGGAIGADERALPLDIPFLTDCGPGEGPPACGAPPALWPNGSPVEFCTTQARRPAWLTAERFRALVADAAAAWGEAEAAIGVRYAGDCAPAEIDKNATGGHSRWAARNGRNEIMFSEERASLEGPKAGLTRAATSWSPADAPTQRVFLETDVFLHSGLAESERCLRALLTHEFGHALGLGHSDDPADVMFPEFDLSDPTACRARPSARERERLQRAYGLDRTPTLRTEANQSVESGAVATVRAAGVDPEGQSIRYRWSQLEGPPVELPGDGPSLTFVAAERAGTRYTFTVTATDPMLHAAAVTVRVTVGRAAPPSPPAAPPPSFASFLVGSDGRAAIGWDGVGAAASFDVCDEVPLTGDARCHSVDEPLLGIDWAEAINASPDSAWPVVLRSGARLTHLQACDAGGCGERAPGPWAGAVRWDDADIAYAYFAMAHDVAGLQFTIVGVVNLSDTARGFLLTNGSDEAPGTHVIERCASVPRGGLCIGLLTPSDGTHGPVAAITALRGDLGSVSSLLAIR